MTQAKTAYQQIRSMIIEGKTRDGYPLLETELASQLKMSRTPVREALLHLRSDGLVEQIKGKGFYVKSISKDEVRQCYEYLEAVEGMLSYLLALSAADESIKMMEQHVSTMERELAGGNVDEWAEADEHFHKAMMDACKNRYIVAELQKVNLIVHSVREMVTKFAIDKAQSTKDHRRMLEAIRNRDAEQARQITQSHINSVRVQLMRIL